MALRPHCCSIRMMPRRSDSTRISRILASISLSGDQRDCSAKRSFGLSQFTRAPTGPQRAFLTQTLSTGYFWTVLSIDPEGARLIQQIASGQRVRGRSASIEVLLGVQLEDRPAVASGYATYLRG